MAGEKYKIGEVSRLLGIPQQTLRYYEEQGILHPKKNESTGYRYYDAWDLNALFDAIHYRALDLFTHLFRFVRMHTRTTFHARSSRICRAFCIR